MHQYYGLLIPLVVAYHWWFADANRTSVWLTRFAGGGLAVVVLTYLSLLFWGVPALRAAVDYSVFGMVGYIDRGMATGNAIWRTPLEWLLLVTRPIGGSAIVMATGLLMVHGFREIWHEHRIVSWWLALFFLASAFPLIFYPDWTYLIVPSVFVALAAERGVAALIDSDSDRT
jgi:hypothetical protein